MRASFSDRPPLNSKNALRLWFLAFVLIVAAVYMDVTEPRQDSRPVEAYPGQAVYTTNGWVLEP